MHPSHRRHAHESRIVLSDIEQMQLWADRFGVDIQELGRAILSVGDDPADLQEELTGIPALRH